MSEDIVVVPSSQVKQRWEAMNKQASALHRPAELTRISGVDRVFVRGGPTKRRHEKSLHMYI